MSLILRGGRVLDPATGTDRIADVLVRHGKLESISEGVEAAGAKVIDCTGLWVTPGLVDLHSVLKDARDVEAALIGGFTTVVAAPESGRVKSDVLQVRVAAPLTRNLAGEELGDIPADAICLSQGFKPIARAGVLRRAMQYAGALGPLLVLHAEDPSLTGAGVIGESVTATRLGLPSVPASAETTIIARNLELLDHAGGRMHFAHVTTARGLELISAAKARGMKVSCDVTPHHLTLDTRAAEGYSLAARVWPPLREEADVQALQRGVHDGTVDAVACDHVRVESLEREHPFEACAPGCEAFGQALPTLFRLGLPPARLIELLAIAPARLLGLASGMGAGQPAALTVIDPRTHRARGVVIGERQTLST